MLQGSRFGRGVAVPPPTLCLLWKSWRRIWGRVRMAGPGRGVMGLALCCASVSPPSIVADSAYRTTLGQGDRDVVPPAPATWSCSCGSAQAGSAQEWLSWN